MYDKKEKNDNKAISIDEHLALFVTLQFKQK